MHSCKTRRNEATSSCRPTGRGSIGPPRTSWLWPSRDSPVDLRGRGRRRRGPEASRSTTSSPRGRGTTLRRTTWSRCFRRVPRGSVRPEQRPTLGGRPRRVPRSSAVLPSRFFGYFHAIWWRHSVVPHRSGSLLRGMAGRGSGETIIRFGWHVQRLRERESSSHGEVPSLCIAVIMQIHEFRRGLAPGALRRDHCQHGMVRTAADRPWRPRLSVSALQRDGFH